jgi:threonine/homoserine efflux transporter RhtA
MPSLLVVASVVSLECGMAFGKSLFASVSPSGVVALRLGLAAAILLAVHRPRLPRRAREVVLTLAFGTAIAGMNLVYPALRFLPVGVAGTIQQLGPLTIAVATSRRPADLVFAGVAGAGIWLVNNPVGAGLPAAGLAFAAASALSMAAYLLLSKRAADETTQAVTESAALKPRRAPGSRTTALKPLRNAQRAPDSETTAPKPLHSPQQAPDPGTAPLKPLRKARRAAGSGAGAGALALALVWAAALWVPAGVAQNGVHLLRPPVVAGGLAVAVLTAVLPYSLEFSALRRVPARVVSALVGLEPAVAAVAGVVVLGEHLAAPAWLGVACVVIAAAAISRTSVR